MNLSKRLLSIASLVPTDSRIIDVGCDHAYLDIYLAMNKNCKCLATDISKKCILTAINNIKKYKLNSKIETKVSDGLNGITYKLTDIIVISGMGTNTIKKILNHKKLTDEIIISTNNDLKEIRVFMVNIGYYIVDEIFLIDNNKPYVIIKFKKGYKKYNKFNYIFGPICVKNKDYINYCINKIVNINKKIPLKYFIKKIYLEYLLIRLKKEKLFI